MSIIQTKLDQPGRNNGRGDLTEGRWRSDIHGSRETKDRVIPHVENIHAETKVVGFSQPDTLDKREVPVLLIWTTERVSWHVTKTGCSRKSVCNYTRGPEARRVQVISQALCRGAGCICTLDTAARRAERSRTAAGLAKR